METKDLNQLEGIEKQLVELIAKTKDERLKCCLVIAKNELKFALTLLNKTIN